MTAYLDFILALFWILMLSCKKFVLLQNEVEIELKIIAGCSYQDEV